MILIFTVENEFSTCDVIDWLVHNNKDFIRINADEKSHFKVDLRINNDASSSIILEYKNQLIDLDKITSFWYRRGGHLNFYTGENLNFFFNSKNFINLITKDLINELKHFQDIYTLNY